MTIVLDGLDIVEEKDLPILTKALKEIVSNADNVVKIFVTSRSSSRIAMLLEADYDIPITRQETQRDMKAFVNHLVDTAVDNKLLLGGNVDQQLQSLLRQTVFERAGEILSAFVVKPSRMTPSRLSGNNSQRTST
ncbi:hypothetical protein ColLi_09155 [Colletotrichum liriopes]|uniref:NACHT domain-containing protein n=1 Tax=Colletotrichum liriopes TaxID=708192 RepID=A0AA37GST3_9PEZI|nr:hypothetical protein ColLi_09155 [Colletotrichum liriopes]